MRAPPITAAVRRARVAAATLAAASFTAATLGLATAPASAAPPPAAKVIAEVDRDAAGEQPRQQTVADDPVVGVRPEALVTTATVLALAMGITGVAAAIRARRRAGD